MTSASKVLALVLAITPALANAACMNDDSFRYFDGGKDRTCRNIRINETRRQALCPIDEVNVACPQTCGSCCENIAGYEFTRFNGLTGDCAWLGAKQERIDRYCDYIDESFNGRTVRDGCPVTCDFCFTGTRVLTGPSASPSASATISPAPSVTASDAPTGTPSSMPTGAPSDAPTGLPSIAPSDEPTRPPSPMPSPFPTLRPTSTPSESPSDEPSLSPSESPSKVPSMSPSDVPSKTPSKMPSDVPSMQPSDVPSMQPSKMPSDVPSMQPSKMPSDVPSMQPSDIPSKSPSDVPSQLPSIAPSEQPSNNPTMSIKPSPLPSVSPTGKTTSSPTKAPTKAPTAAPVNPTAAPVASTCVNSSTFTFTLVKEGTTVGCGWITNHKRVATRRKNYCSSSAIANACPQACATCIADDPLFTFQLKKKRTIQGCEWITRNLSKITIRKAYCDRPNVQAGCPVTCA